MTWSAGRVRAWLTRKDNRAPGPFRSALINWASVWDVVFDTPLTSAAKTCCALLDEINLVTGSAGACGRATSTARRKDVKGESGGIPSSSWRALAGSSGAVMRLLRISRSALNGDRSGRLQGHLCVDGMDRRGHRLIEGMN